MFGAPRYGFWQTDFFSLFTSSLAWLFYDRRVPNASSHNCWIGLKKQSLQKVFWKILRAAGPLYSKLFIRIVIDFIDTCNSLESYLRRVPVLLRTFNVFTIVNSSSRAVHISFWHPGQSSLYNNCTQGALARGKCWSVRPSNCLLWLNVLYDSSIANDIAKAHLLCDFKFLLDGSECNHLLFIWCRGKSWGLLCT